MSETEDIELDNDLKFAINQDKSEIVYQIIKTFVMRNVSTYIRGLIREAFYNLNTDGLTTE